MVLTIFSAYSVSAEIMLSQPKSIYNLGENLVLTAEVSAIKSGFLEINLECGENKVNLYNSILTSKKTELNIPLKRNYIGSLKGNCDVAASYSGELSKTAGFKISDSINLITNIDKLNAEPGDNIIVNGEAIKENEVNAAGFVELSISETNLNVLKSFDKGKFSINLTLPKDIEGKSYVVNVRAYEKIDDEITNEGKASINLNVKKQPSKIDIAIDEQSVKPGANVSFRATIYDQSKYEILGDISIVILDPEEEIVMSKAVKSGEKNIFDINNSYSAGYWTIQASSLGISSKRLFYVEENEEADFSMDNATLIITNIGNVPYKKTVQIAIGNELVIRQMDLDVGEISKYRLAAPDGNYRVSVTDGTKTREFGEISLTGNVIGLMDIRNQAGALGRYPIVWIFLILVFGLFVLMIINKMVNRKHRGFSKEKMDKDKRGEIGVPEAVSGDAQHTLVLKGNKEESAVLSLKLKSNVDKSLIDDIINEVKNNKGIIYKAENDLTGIFTPAITKTFDNEVKAVNAAKKIEELLKKRDINFGIGINTGDIIAKKEGNGLKFTSLGNTLSLARKMAGLSDRQTLLSENSSKKARNLVKTEKKGEFYVISRIVDRDLNKKFVDNFLKRQQK